jgi:hypothetical protein
LDGTVTNAAGKPFLERRGIKFNIPLDARTPSYDDSGDAAQKNIAETWNWEFWEEFTHQIDNPITVDYHRQAVKTFLLTYPDIKGIGVTAGEHMPHSWEGVNREEWLWNTFGEGILDAKREQPERKVDFIHRVWHSDMDQI